MATSRWCSIFYFPCFAPLAEEDNGRQYCNITEQWWKYAAAAMEKGISCDVCDVSYTAHFHKSTCKHRSWNQIRKSVTDLYMEPKKPSGHVGFRRKPYLGRLVPVSPPSVRLSQHRAHTHLFTLGECVQAEPLSPDSQPHSDVQSQVHIRLPTPRWVAQTSLIPQLRGSAVRSGQIPFLQNSDTTRANVPLTPQRRCGPASSSVDPALTSVGLNEKHSPQPMLQRWAWILTNNRIAQSKVYGLI